MARSGLCTSVLSSVKTGRGLLSRLPLSPALSRCSVNVSPINVVSFDYGSIDYAPHAPNLPLLKNPPGLPEEHTHPHQGPQGPAGLCPLLSTLRQASSSRPTAFAYAIPSAYTIPSARLESSLPWPLSSQIRFPLVEQFAFTSAVMVNCVINCLTATSPHFLRPGRAGLVICFLTLSPGT